MTNEKYARVPGASSMANGGRNIRRRIEAIVRFKRYPAGMTLAAVCTAVLLGVPLLLGTQARSVYNIEGSRLPAGVELKRRWRRPAPSAAPRWPVRWTPTARRW